MIVNPTTLLLGAGASHPIYPLGSELREAIIDLEGMAEYRRVLERYANEPRAREQLLRHNQLRARFRDSQVASIDAFLAEPENSDLEEMGRVAIAAALLPREKKEIGLPWYADLFNAIRHSTSADERRIHRLNIVTFNYDLSLEYYLIRAFQNTYNMTPEAARERFKEAVKITHVYGTIGQIKELTGSEDDRPYGINPQFDHLGNIDRAAKDIKIIRPADEQTENFKEAFDALNSAEFVAILGYGFDPTNNDNLRLQAAVAEKFPFATAFGLGCGARARLNQMAHQSHMIMGGKTEGVREFLQELDLLHWINKFGATAKGVAHEIGHVFKNSMLPYVR